MSRSNIATGQFVKHPSGTTGTFRLNLDDLQWLSHGIDILPHLKPEARDLLEVARVVHELDRLAPRRIAADRIRKIELAMTVRRPSVWTKAAVETLSELLHVMGNVQWSFTFSGRTGTAHLDSMATTANKPRRFRQVVLFSGGLDSTGGLAELRASAADTLLCSYYARNLQKQREIAKALGYSNISQIQSPWKHPRGHLVGGQFWYRSFFFLILASCAASVTSASHFYQFENGPLALAVPPEPIYRMTRHAHPRVHRLVERLNHQLLGRKIEIRNPFVGLTKREVVAKLRAVLSDPREFQRVVAGTETCWQLRARSIIGKVGKENSEPCGACIPCLVRRTALRDAEVKCAANLTAPGGKHYANQAVRVHVDAYRAFAQRLMDKHYSLSEFLTEIPLATETALVLGETDLEASAVYDLYRRFAREILQTFR